MAGPPATANRCTSGRTPALDQTLVATGFGYETEVRTRQAQAMARMLPQVRDIRRQGSCALDLCAVAAGQVDAYVEEGPHTWDYAAGGLVARESGAIVEIWTSVVGHDLVVCAPEAGWSGFSGLVRAVASWGTGPPERSGTATESPIETGGNKRGVACVDVCV